MSRDLRPEIMDALDSSAARCPNYYAGAAKPCDGLDGCEACLERAATAVLIVLERSGVDL